MSKGNESWWGFAAKAAVLGVVVLVGAFVGVRLANAGPGEPVRKALTVSGTLTGPMVGSNPTATFRFYRAMGDTTALCAPQVTIRDGMDRDTTTGAFSVEVPLDQSGVGRPCPDTLFHDPIAYVEVAIRDTPVVTRRPINPVPYAVYAQQYGTPDCPVGYEREIDPSEGFPQDASTRLCRKCRGPGRFENCYDDVVRVGAGASAFWIDRYEASVWATENAQTGSQRGANADDYDVGSPSVPDNGQYGAGQLYARSVAGVLPSSFLTWFQANEACFASGKRLAHGDEWLLAARNTPDPTTEQGDGRERRCLTRVTTPQPTGGRSPAPSVRVGCQSFWGAQDMIGNVSEWTTDWYAGLSNPLSGDVVDAWGGNYGYDSSRNIGSVAFGNSGSRRIPAAALRGGHYGSESNAGVFDINLGDAPSNSLRAYGFRCVIPR